MAYKITKSNEKNLQRAINNFNAKVRRLEKTDRSLQLPIKENINIIKGRIYDKRSLKREIDRLQLFTQRGMEQSISLDSGISITKYEYENLLKEQKRLSSKLYRTQKKIEKIIPTEGGSKLHYKVIEMGRDDLTNVRDKREELMSYNLKKLGEEDFKEFRQFVNDILRHERYDESIFIDNFTNQMVLNLGYWAGVDDEKLEHIRKQLSTLSEKQFMKLYNTEEYIRAIKDYYNEINKKKITPEQIAKNMEKVKELYNELDKYIEKIVADYQ